jgi:hypothetical protein
MKELLIKVHEMTMSSYGLGMRAFQFGVIFGIKNNPSKKSGGRSECRK